MKKRLPMALAITLGLIAAATVVLVLQSRTRVPVGLEAGRLQPCPAKPNCVCSQDQGEAAIEPLAAGDLDQALDRIVALVEADGNATVVSRSEGYLHAEWKTPLLGFRDDVEFLLDREAGLVHVRSASRVGHSDMGANRKRVEAIRAQLADAN